MYPETACQTSMIELFRENSDRLTAVNYFQEPPPPLPPPSIDVWQGPKYTVY